MSALDHVRFREIPLYFFPVTFTVDQTAQKTPEYDPVFYRIGTDYF